jgi:hypothetical protein
MVRRYGGWAGLVEGSFVLEGWEGWAGVKMERMVETRVGSPRDDSVCYGSGSVNFLKEILQSLYIWCRV